MDARLREIEISDAPAVAELSAELGYPVDVPSMEERIRGSARSPDCITFVACLGEAVVGWIDIFVVHHLQSGASAEIGGLVVSSACRNAGIGARLLLRAEEWARDKGLPRVVVRSRITREAAHRFYLRQGYERSKTSAVFAKPLQPRE